MLHPLATLFQAGQKKSNAVAVFPAQTTGLQDEMSGVVSYTQGLEPFCPAG